MYSVDQVAKKLGVSLGCIYALVESRNLPHYRIGIGRGTIRISEDQLQDYLRKHEEKRPAKVPTVPVKLKHLSLK